MRALVPLCVIATLSLAPAALAKNVFGDCRSRTDAVYSLPDTRLSLLNPWLAADASFQALLAAGCAPARAGSAVCHDKPAVGSGLAQLSSNSFLALTDRGPNQDCADLVGRPGKGFPVPRFAPSLVHFDVAPDTAGRALRLRKTVPLRGTDGAPVSGLPNTPADDTPYGAGCVGSQLAYDPSGLDPEDVARVPGTDFVVLVDEYAPSVVVANYHTGVIRARHVPVSLGDALSGASYPIRNDIPDVFAQRRKNRGFEGVVVDADARYVIAVLQSPMLGDDDEATAGNGIIRCAYFDLDVSADGVPVLAYRMSFAIEASRPEAYTVRPNTAKDLKYSAAQHLESGKFVVLERAKGQVKLFLVDFVGATDLDVTPYADNLGLERETNGTFTAAQRGVVAASKTLIWDSAAGVGGSVDFDGSSKQEGFAIDVEDDSKVWMINDNDFGLGNNENTELRRISLGRSPHGATVCQKPAHPARPDIDVEPSRSLRLTNPKTFRVSDKPGAGAAENLDVSESSARAYVANDNSGAVDMYDVSTSPVTPVKSYEPGKMYKPSSSSACETFGLVAVGLFNTEDSSLPGRVDILSKDLQLYRKIQRSSCVLVDHVKWSDDCRFLVAACEGEGASVPGGVLVVDFMGPAGNRFRGAQVADFKQFDALTRFFAENGVRLIESDTPSVDFEPEYVAISGNHAFVTLQEANVVAVVDLLEAKVTELKPIGFIDRSRTGFGLDASNKDGGINIRNYPLLYGMPQPDAIASYVAADNATYLVFANEGDSKESEEFRGADITDADELNRVAAPRLKPLVEDKSLLGRLKFSAIEGYNKSTNTQEKMFHFGSRSFSIMATDGSIVFDSGEWFARIQEKHFPEIFNANGFDDEDLSESQADLMDSRSDDKGAEPESLSLMSAKGRTYAFIGFERASIVVVFDVTDPRAPVFVEAASNNPSDVSMAELFREGRQGDLDPEGLFASAKLRKLFVSGSVSNTVSSYEIET